MKGTYIMPALPPWCSEVRTPVEVVRWMGDRVLLRDLPMQAKGVNYLIDASLDSFEPDIPPIPDRAWPRLHAAVDRLRGQMDSQLAGEGQP